MRREADPRACATITSPLSEKPAEDVPSELLVDFPVPRDRLRHPRFGILVPVVAAAVSDEHATSLLDPPNQLPSESTPAASCDDELVDPADTLDLAARQIPIEVQ